MYFGLKASGNVSQVAESSFDILLMPRFNQHRDFLEIRLAEERIEEGRHSNELENQS